LVGASEFSQGRGAIRLFDFVIAASLAEVPAAGQAASQFSGKVVRPGHSATAYARP